MNSVYVTGCIDSPVIVLSSPNTPLHIRTSIRVSHYTANGKRREDVFPLSVWHEKAKQFMECVRTGSHISLNGYLTTSKENKQMEITVKFFQLTSKMNRIKPPISKTEEENHGNEE